MLLCLKCNEDECKSYNDINYELLRITTMVLRVDTLTVSVANQRNIYFFGDEKHSQNKHQLSKLI